MLELREIKPIPAKATYDEMSSPVGPLFIITSGQGLHAILWRMPNLDLVKAPNEDLIVETKTQLQEYFANKRRSFDLPVVLDGTDFQVEVWKKLMEIPYATTISYGEQAKRIGDKKKARAVGTANGRNPISIIIPCHRVIASNGTLAGFGGGLDNKAYLLNLERCS